jgi:hypothetical protein
VCLYSVILKMLFQSMARLLVLKSREVFITNSFSSSLLICIIEGFGFVEFDDKRDAEDAMKGIHETVAELVVEWAKNGGKRPSENECYHCGRSGHYARDCREGGRRDRDQRSRGGYDRRYTIFLFLKTSFVVCVYVWSVSSKI